MNYSYITGSTTSSSLDNSTANSTEAANTFYKVWTAMFFVVLTFNFIGNFLVITVIMIDSKFHSTMNYLFVNMAFSDFLSGIFAMLWYITDNVTPEWRSEWVCRIVAANSITVVSGLVSIFTLTAITLERYNAIINPLEHRMSWLRFKLILLLIWTLAIGCSSPYFIFIDAFEINGKTHCMYVLSSPKWRQLIVTLVFVFMYVCPNTVICIAYGKLVKYLWFNKETDSMQDSHQALLRSRKKITKLLGSVLLVFNLCTFPNSVADFMLSFGGLGYGHKFPQIVFLLQLTSTCVNPLIFFIQSKQFRYRLINLLCCRAKVINRWGTLRGTGPSSTKHRRTQSTSQYRQATV